MFVHQVWCQPYAHGTVLVLACAFMGTACCVLIAAHTKSAQEIKRKVTAAWVTDEHHHRRLPQPCRGRRGRVFHRAERRWPDQGNPGDGTERSSASGASTIFSLHGRCFCCTLPALAVHLPLAAQTALQTVQLMCLWCLAGPGEGFPGGPLVKNCFCMLLCT